MPAHNTAVNSNGSIALGQNEWETISPGSTRLTFKLDGEPAGGAFSESDQK